MTFLSQKNILLSISILISNRPDTVGKCLRSLESLRGKVPSELILVDTGCGEQVRKIIESYADKIVNFEWCNDFSKARNAGLKQAEGEWFLYLDDDEWFENTDEIEEFFLSGKYLKYNQGDYLVRNYLDLEGTKYRDIYVGRLVRLYPDVEFKYSIHEVLVNARLPLIKLNSYAHHYGYAFESEEELQRHGRRNIELLLAEHEKNPSELHHVLQLAQEYNALKEWNKSIEISRKGIQNALPGAARDCLLGGLYANSVRGCVILKQYEEAVELGEKYLGMEEPDELARANVFYYLCIAYLEIGENAKSLKAVQQYEDIYAKWEKDKEVFGRFENLLTDHAFSESAVKAVFYRGVRCGIRLGNAGLAKRYFDEIKWDTEKESVDLDVLDVVQDLVRAWLKTDADMAQDYTDMMRCFLRDTVLTKVVMTDMDLLRQKTPQVLQNRRADWGELAKENWIFLYFKIKNRVETDKNILIKDYCKLWKNTTDALMRAKELELWKLAQRDSIQMKQIISHIPIYRWKRATEIAIAELDWQNVQEIWEYLQETLDGDSFSMLYWVIPYKIRKIRLMTANMDGKEIASSAEDIVKELQEYSSANQKLYRRLYREEVFLKFPGLLPQTCQFSLKITYMTDAMGNGDMQRALSAVREALEIMPELSDALKCCTKWISEKSAARRAEQEKARDEIKKLSEAVKMQVRNMMAMGMISEAAEVLGQLKTMVPEDKEVMELEKKIVCIQLNTESGKNIQ